MKEVYLGDGLYASFDGFGVTLRAPIEHGDHTWRKSNAYLSSLVLAKYSLRKYA